MDTTLLLSISLAAALCGNVVRKIYTNRSEGGAGIFVFSSVGCLVAAVVLIAWGGIGKISPFTALLGLLFGAVTAMQTVANMAALRVGPLSYKSVIISCSTLISALSGFFFFGESIGVWEILGILSMLISFLLAHASDEKERKGSALWLLLCGIAFLATGAIGVMQKLHQSSAFRSELNGFLILAFLVSAFVSGVVAIALRKRMKGKSSGGFDTRGVLLCLSLMLCSGICCAVNNLLNLHLSGVMDSAVFFPIVNGGGLLLTTLAAFLIFRERLTGKQWIGVGFGIASVVLLCVGA